MSGQIFTATEKATGRSWYYQMRRTYGRLEFRFCTSKGAWAPTLKQAKVWAKEAGHFRYNDEPALVTIVED